MTLPLVNSYWVIPERFLAGEHPFGENPHDAQNRFAALRAAGIDFFLDLTEIGERPAYKRLLHRNASYVRYPIVDCGIPASDDQMRQIQAVIRAALAENQKLYIHCHAGIGRTGLVVGCYLADEGLGGKAALQKLNKLWQQSERSKSWPAIPQTAEQANYVRQWSESGARRARPPLTR
jgi:Dual specificity phosphatase, catalytic domain